MRNTLPCVGFAVVMGCLMLVVVPEDNTWYQRDLTQAGWLPPTIVIDAGHGGRDHGARQGGIQEKELTLDIAYRLDTILREAGFRTVMTRTDDRYVALGERVAVANALDDALFVSIHLNSSPGLGPAGIETYFATAKEPPRPWRLIGFFAPPTAIPDPDSENLAGSIHAAMLGKTGSPDRGIRARQFYVVHHTRCPAVLVEAGFINNLFEGQLLATPTYRQIVAQAVAEGIAGYHRTRLRNPEPRPLAATGHHLDPG